MSWGTDMADGNPDTSNSARLKKARERAEAIDNSESHESFVDVVRKETPWRFNEGNDPDQYLHNVRHHLMHFVPRLLASMGGEIRSVFDFGCGSGSGSIALAMMFPEIRCVGFDINPVEIAIAHEQAKLYGVSDRCHFRSFPEGGALPARDGAFDLCICCSVLEYITDAAVRKFCVQEMVRVIAPGGLLFMSVPNRLYPIELHRHKLGWNWFPKLLKASSFGATTWEIRRLARPQALMPYRTPLVRLLTPWTNFCLRREAAPADLVA